MTVCLSDPDRIAGYAGIGRVLELPRDYILYEDPDAPSFFPDFGQPSYLKRLNEYPAFQERVLEVFRQCALRKSALLGPVLDQDSAERIDRLANLSRRKAVRRTHKITKAIVSSRTDTYEIYSMHVIRWLKVENNPENWEHRQAVALTIEFSRSTENSAAFDAVLCEWRTCATRYGHLRDLSVRQVLRNRIEIDLKFSDLSGYWIVALYVILSDSEKTTRAVAMHFRTQ